MQIYLNEISNKKRLNALKQQFDKKKLIKRPKLTLEKDKSITLRLDTIIQNQLEIQKFKNEKALNTDIASEEEY